MESSQWVGVPLLCLSSIRAEGHDHLTLPNMSTEDILIAIGGAPKSRTIEYCNYICLGLQCSV